MSVMPKYTGVRKIRLARWAEQNGISYRTAYRLYTSGLLPVPTEKLATGTILCSVDMTASGITWQLELLKSELRMTALKVDALLARLNGREN